MNDTAAPQPLILIADVVSSRSDFAASAAALARLARELDRRYGSHVLARFDFTQGDELQGIVQPAADPFVAVLVPALAEKPLRLRWAVVRGDVEPGRGPATRRSGPGFITARRAIQDAERRRVGLVVRIGDDACDALLGDLAPLLPVLLADLSPRQREIARLMLIDGLRQAEVASRLGVSRASVSVAHRRARIDAIAGLMRALRSLLAGGTTAGRAAVAVEAPPVTAESSREPRTVAT